MKATRMMFTVLILGIMTAFTSSKFVFNTTEKMWQYLDINQVYYTTYSISEINKDSQIEVYYQDKLLPVVIGNTKYCSSVEVREEGGGIVAIAVNTTDGSKPENPGKKSFQIICK